MPNARPLIPDDLVAQLARNGVTQEEAADDFERGTDIDEGTTRVRAGRLALYRYRTMVVLGQPEILITEVMMR